MQTGQRDICGRYRLTAKVGQGGTGSVYRAVDLLLGRPVALKVLHDTSLDLAHEGFSLAQVDHPNVVALHDVIQDAGRQWLVMEYVDGATLEEMLARQGTLGLDGAVATVRRIGEAVAAAHDRGVLHCDLKPANVLLTPAGQIKLTDFTLARVIGHTRGRAGGSGPYAAPEQLAGEASPRTDIYGLGRLLQRLAGPIGDEAARPVAAAIERATAPDPADRFPTVRDFLAALPSPEDVTRITAAPRDDLTRILPPRSAPHAPRRWPLGVLCAALALTTAAVSAHFTVFASPDRVRVPALVATQSQSAQVVSRSLDLQLHILHRYASAPAGAVLSQRPAAGSVVAPGSAVTLVVSNGPAPAPVPNLTGVSQRDAFAALIRQGFKVVTRTQDTIAHPAGLVLTQSPAPATRLLPGATVTITVSTKPWWWIF